jgi:YbbR domain-containing protein
MVSIIKSIIRTKPTLKISSVLFGYMWWSILNYHQPVKTSFTIPVAFYNQSENIDIDAPQKITIYITGKRSLLTQLRTESLCAHIDAKNFRTGSHLVHVSLENLFLPEGIHLIDYVPSPLVVRIKNTRSEKGVLHPE